MVPWAANDIAQGILTYLQIAYPIILLFLYLIAFTVRSIATSRNDNNRPEPQLLGQVDSFTQSPTSSSLTCHRPGGKPLPKKHPNKKDTTEPNHLDFSRPRKLLFQWLTVAIIFTLIGNIVLVIAHALWARKERWWAGQAPTVCCRSNYIKHLNAC